MRLPCILIGWKSRAIAQILACGWNRARLPIHQSSFAMRVLLAHNTVNDPASLALRIHERWLTLTNVGLASWLPRTTLMKL